MSKTRPSINDDEPPEVHECRSTDFARSTTFRAFSGRVARVRTLRRSAKVSPTDAATKIPALSAYYVPADSRPAHVAARAALDLSPEGERPHETRLPHRRRGHVAWVREDAPERDPGQGPSGARARAAPGPEGPGRACPARGVLQDSPHRWRVRHAELLLRREALGVLERRGRPRGRLDRARRRRRAAPGDPRGRLPPLHRLLADRGRAPVRGRSRRRRAAAPLSHQ